MKKQQETSDSSKIVYLHSEHHPNGVTAKRIHTLFSQHCPDMKNALNTALCLSYSLPPNAQDATTKTSLYNLPKLQQATDLIQNIIHPDNSGTKKKFLLTKHAARILICPIFL